MPIHQELSGPTTILFNRPRGALIPKINDAPLNYNYDDHHNTLKIRQNKLMNNDTPKKPILIPSESTVPVQREVIGPGNMASL